MAIQGSILEFLAGYLDEGGLVVDRGGGSGRLMERILDRFPAAHGVIIDQSEPFLALAERRLARFGPRATCVLCRQQGDWPSQIQGAAATPHSAFRIPHSALRILNRLARASRPL